MSVYLSGRSLACALGASLEQSVATLKNAGSDVKPAFLDIDDARLPYFQIPYENSDWYARAQYLVQQAVQEAGVTDKRGALFIASSSFDIGALEHGEPFAEDGYVFTETVAQWLNWQGPVYSVTTACTSAINALRSATALLNAGAVDHACVLGLELNNLFSLRGFSALQLLAPTRAQPWRSECNGLVLGEAVSALSLTKQSSRWRISASANIVDGRVPTSASQPALSTLYRELLDQAGVSAAQIDFIKLHAAGNPGNDEIEAAALAEIFSASTPRVTFKHLYGHTLGASGAAEIALLTACLEHKICPPPPSGTFDTALGLDLATKTPASVQYALATLLGFGGGHTAVLLEDTAA